MKIVHGFKRSKGDTTIKNIRSGSTFRKTNSSSRVSSAKEEAVVGENYTYEDLSMVCSKKWLSVGDSISIKLRSPCRCYVTRTLFYY